MKILIFTNDDGPESRSAQELGGKLEADGRTVEYHNSESEESHTLQETYDIYSYPTFVVAQDDGSQIEIWRATVPLESDIKMYLG